MTENQEGSHSGNWYVLTIGLPELPEPVIITHGLTLRPLESDLSIFDLAAAGAVGFKSWSMLEPIAQLCNCEIESARDEALTPGYDALNRVWLASALLCLRGFTRHFCIACSAYSWNEIAGHQGRSQGDFKQQLVEEGVERAVFSPSTSLPPFKGNLLDFHTKYLTTKHNRVNSPINEDALWIRAKFETFNQLAATNNAFRFALEASVDWRYSTDRRAAVARLWSGIESLFGLKSELVYRIALQSASLLEPRGEKRTRRFKEIKKLYNLRSKAVHGGPLSDDQIQVALDDSYALLRDLLLYCVDSGETPEEDRILDALLG